jgi:hypothetical protein
VPPHRGLTGTGDLTGTGRRGLGDLRAERLRAVEFGQPVHPPPKVQLGDGTYPAGAPAGGVGQVRHAHRSEVRVHPGRVPAHQLPGALGRTQRLPSRELRLHPSRPVQRGVVDVTVQVVRSVRRRPVRSEPPGPLARHGKHVIGQRAHVVLCVGIADAVAEVAVAAGEHVRDAVRGSPHHHPAGTPVPTGRAADRGHRDTARCHQDRRRGTAQRKPVPRDRPSPMTHDTPLSVIPTW